MLSQSYRFHSRGGVKYTYLHGESIRGSGISLVVNNNDRRKKNRFSVIVSKKVLKSAVGRNRIRRRVYEVIREEILNIRAPLDVLVVIYNKDIKDIKYSELKDELISLFKQAKIYKSTD